ncbi:hypothetical protein [Neobacillus sp. D3-1R]|uniref:hypothetical protein n=1 Tax=Neobacillus sp. D3-1R TaxID=3445778 RepID=UPI003FA00893
MGYILPYTSLRDLQYLSRESKSQHRLIKPEAISPLKPISPETNFNHGYNQQRTRNKNLEAEEIMKELTGKGQYFNERI